MSNLKCPYCLKLHIDGECTKEDLRNALDFYESKRFFHKMKDGWTAENFLFDGELKRYIDVIKILLDESVKMNII